MITYLPEIYPDELIYGWLSRYFVYSGYCNHKTALLELLCKKSDTLSKEFIGNLNPEAKKIITNMYRIDYLILNHTMFSQYARFMPYDKKKKALQQLKNKHCDIHKLFTILPRTYGEKYLKYCPMCADEDRNTYGEAYWHRKHQIRNINICTKHKCKLIDSNVSAKSERSYTFCATENHIKDSSIEMENNQNVIRFAEYIEKVFDSPVYFDNEIPICAAIYYAIESTKYLNKTGNSRNTDMLCQDIKKYYESFELNSIASKYQIQRALLGTQFEFSVICQISFFLGISICDLTNPKLTYEQIDKEKALHSKQDTIDAEKLDKEMSIRLEQIVKDIYEGSINDMKRPERVSNRIIEKEIGLSFYRLDTLPMCNKIFEKYKESYPESWARKIIWSYKILEEKRGNTQIYWSDIRSLSGVKKKNFEATIPYLHKHADKITVDKIISLINGS